MCLSIGECTDGQYCSKKAIGSITNSFCDGSLGCQLKYSNCITRCGKGVGFCLLGQCCSKKSYCDITSAFC